MQNSMLKGSTSNHTIEQNSNESTLIGDATTHEFHDAVGITSEGKIISETLDDVGEDLSLFSSLHPTSEDHHSIESILSRPIRNAVIKWDTTKHPRGQLLGSIHIPTLIRSPPFQMIFQKLQGFYGIHATVKLRCMVNAQPFQSGMFALHYIPFHRSLQAVPARFSDTEFSLPFLSGCPTVYCNIANQSSVELSVPYTGPRAFYSLVDLKNDADWGTFLLTTFSPISSSDSNTTAEISTYVSFHDVRLFGATPLWTAQMEKAEEESKSSGNISRVVRDIVSGNHANTIIDLMNVLGLSSPVVNQSPSRFVISPYANIALCDSTSAALKLSALSSQAVKINSIGVDKADEMDIRHIVSVPNYLMHVEWPSSVSAYQKLVSIPVEPNAHLRKQQDGNIMVANTRLRYVSNLFNFWRGTIRFTIHIIATKFHSGRLRLVYTLGGALTDVNLANKLPYSFSEIVDIRDGLVFHVNCPYFSSTPWRVLPRFASATDPWFINSNKGVFDDDPCSLDIFVENQLVGNSSVASNVDILVFVSGGPDFEVSAPTFSTDVPIVIGSKEQVNLLDAKNKTKRKVVNFEKQESVSEYYITSMKLQSDESGDIPTINMVCSSLRLDDTICSSITTGERITNLRLLLKRYSCIGRMVMSSKKMEHCAMFPFLIPQPLRATGAAQGFWYDVLSYLYPMYRFYRGGMRYLVKTVPGTEINIKYDTATSNEVLSTNWKFTDPIFGSATPMFRVVPSDIKTSAQHNFQRVPSAVSFPSNSLLQGGIEFEVPYYSVTHKCLANKVIKAPKDVNQAIADKTMPNGFVVLEMFNYTATDDSADLYRAVADDFNFGFLLGAPMTSSQISYFPA